MRHYTLVLLALVALATIQTLNPVDASEKVIVRSKRGISDFFRRFWGGRKKPAYQQNQSPVYPMYNQEYLYGQASNLYPMYQYSGNGGNLQQLQSQAQQIYAAEQSQNAPGYYQPYQQNGQFQSPQYQGENANGNQAQYSNYQNGQSAEESSNQQMFQQGGQQNGYQSNGYNMAQASAPYAASVNPSQANTFSSRPYGPNPGNIDVHQVLDQFIRNAGLSPQGDHESAKGDQSFAESGTKPVFTFKKLYSYPFYFTSSGDKASPGYDYSGQGGNIRRQSSEEQLVNAALKKSLLASQKMDIASDAKSGDYDESSFIAKNAAALQEFLSNKGHEKENKIQQGNTNSKAE